MIVVRMVRISSVTKDETEMRYVIDAPRDVLAGYTEGCANEKCTDSGIK